MTFYFRNRPSACLIGALTILTSLGGCAPTPISLISAVDLVLTATDDAPAAPAGPISIENLLANARNAASSDREVARPTAQLDRAPEGLDGPAYIALGTFMSALNPAQDHTIVITRSTADAAQPFADAQFAILVGQLLTRAGHNVQLEISAAQARGSLHLTVQDAGAET